MTTTTTTTPAWFLAVEVPDHVRPDVAAAIGPLLPPGCEPVPADKYHLTLLYVGRVADPLDRARFVRVSAAETAATDPFTLELLGLGTFPPARVAKLGVTTGHHELVDLWRRLHSATEGIGDSPRVHPGEMEPTFEPHLTVGRFASDRDPATIPVALDPRWSAPSFVVRELVLLASAAGAYAAVERFALGEPATPA